MSSVRSKREICILFVACGRRVSLIEAFRKHLSPGDRLLGTDVTSRVPTRFVLDELFVVPPWLTEDGVFDFSFVQEIRRIVLVRGVDLVIPLMDSAAEALRGVRLGAPVLGSADPGLDYDKRLTASFFESLGLLIPEIVDNPADPDKWPIIGRPVWGGTGSRGVHVIRDERSFTYFCWPGDNPEMVYSKFVDGPEYTVDCFKDFEGRLLCVVPRKRLEVRNGEVQKGQTVHHSEVIAQATRIAEAFSFTGLMCTQCIEAQGNLYWLEINARFGGGTPLSIAAGADSPLWVIQMLRGERPAPLDDFVDLTMVRADREFFYAETPGH